MEEYVKRYEEWCSNPYFDAETQAELKAIADNDTFYMIGKVFVK